MQTFKDTAGETWNLEVTLATIKRVAAETGHQLLSLAEPGSDLLKAIARDPLTLFPIIAAILRPQLKEQGFTDDTFAERLNEQAVEDACTALLEATFDFFQPRKRDVLKGAHAQVMQAYNRLRTKSLDSAEAALQSPTIEADIERILQSGFGGSP